MTFQDEKSGNEGQFLMNVVIFGCSNRQEM